MSDNNAYLFRHKFIHVRGSAVVKGELETIESRSKVYLNVDRRRERFFMRILHCIMTSERKESFFLLTERIFETSRVTVFFTLTCRHKSLCFTHYF